MFRNPVCPHCKTVYRYKDTKTAIKNKTNTCYHCQKEFKASLFPTVLVGAVIPLVLCILTNMFLLSKMENLSLAPLLISTLGYMLIFYLIIPFFTRFKKTAQSEEKNEKKKK